MSQSTPCLGFVVPLSMFIIKKYICGYLQIITSTSIIIAAVWSNRQRGGWVSSNHWWRLLVATVFGLLLKQYEIPDWVIMILRQIFFWSLFRLLFWPICRKRIQSAFSVLQPSAYERVMQSVYTIKSTHNQFQHYKKNDINFALSFLPID